MQSLKFNEDVPCDYPFHIKNPRFTGLPGSERYIPVPCGTCPGCAKRRSDGWQFRLLQQDKISETAVFATLTYNTDHVPLSKKGYMTLNKRDYQLFMKRLRKAHPKDTVLKYYAVGEYGTIHKRPHYHAIIFNVDKELIADAWTNPETGLPIGDIFLGDVSGASVAYTTKYLHKGKIIPEHKNDDRLPEFSLMSKKLGLNYITPEIIRYHQEDLNRNYVILEGGVKIALPRYFREKIYTEEQREQQGKNIAAVADQAEQQRIREFTERTGNPDDYVRAKAEAKKQKLINHRQQAKLKRK